MLKASPPNLRLRTAKQLQTLHQCVLLLLPLSLFYSLLSVIFSTFSFPTFVFLCIYPYLLPNLLFCSFLLYFCSYLFFVLWPIHIPLNIFTYSLFDLHTVLNFSLSVSFCFSLSSFHYISFLIFYLLITCPLILLVFLFLWLFLPVHILQMCSLSWTSAWSIGSYVHLLPIQIYFWT